MISLEKFFTTHGEADDKPRTVLPFHRAALDALEGLIVGRLPGGKPNLMILMPPSHGKSFMVSDFILYSLGIVPDSQFIYTSYAADVAYGQTAKTSEALGSEWYNRIFPGVKISSKSREMVATSAGGMIYTVGMGGALTGFRAGQKRAAFGGAIVIDDPTKADDARSETVLQHTVEWYTGALGSRKNSSDTPTILIMQRLAPGDLAGHILKTEGELWHVVKIPALSEDGAAIWPQTKSAAALLKLKEVDEFAYNAQYQQDPQIPGGNLIKRKWWRYYHAARYDVAGLVFIVADTGMKPDDANDPTVFTAYHATQQYLDVLDVLRGRWDFPELVKHAKGFYDKWKPYGCEKMYVEDKANGDPMAKMLRQQGVPCRLWSPQDYGYPLDKLGRAKYSLWFIEAGRIRLPDDNPPWVVPWIDEHAAFSGAKTDTDDQVENVLTLFRFSISWTFLKKTEHCMFGPKRAEQ